MGYNPADYAAVENTAKAMSKDELERDYVDAKNKKHSNQGEVFMCILGILFIIFFIGHVGYGFAFDNIEDNMQEVSDSVAQQVCRVSRGIYVEVDLKGSTYDMIIDCSRYRFK